jgi:CubicO group peptidase (beta-lactamase class C family)
MAGRAIRGAVLLSMLVLLPSTAGAQPAEASRPGWAPRVDALFAEWDRPDSPGCALALYQGGRIVYERGYGMADLEHDVPIAPETVFYAGSVSKQFTAMAAALAIQQGRLSPDDDIRTYLPELPDYGTPIRVRHLVYHTSGLRDVNTLLAMAGRRGDEAFDNLAVLRILARQKALNFRPGAEYLYSNSGYALLALVVERATGMPFSAYADEHIFQPLGMTATRFHDDLSRLLRHRANGYEWRAGGLRLSTPYNERVGAGGVYTSVRDLLEWDRNFRDGRVGGRRLLDELQTPGRLDSGRPLDYAWGLRVSTHRGLPIVEHGGALGGYRAHLLRFPDQRFTVALLCNLASTNPGAIAREIAAIRLGVRLAQVRPAAAGAGQRSGRHGGRTAAPPALPAERLAAHAGEYSSEELDVTFDIKVVGARLEVRRGTAREALPLLPGPEGTFRLAGATLRFTDGADGAIDGFTMDTGRVRGVRFERRPRHPSS